MQSNKQPPPNTKHTTLKEELRDTFVQSRFKAYLQTTLRMTRKAYGIRRTRYLKHTAFMDSDELNFILDRQSIAQKSDYSDLYWAISQLNEAQAAVIRLYYLQGQTNEQIARQRHVTRQAVEAMRRRGLCSLKEILETS